MIKNEHFEMRLNKYLVLIIDLSRIIWISLKKEVLL